MSDFKKYLQEQLKDSEFQKEWNNLEPEFNTIQALIDAITALENKSNNTQQLGALEKQLVEALADKTMAETTLNEILAKLAGAAVTRDQIIDRLTPDTDTTSGGGGGRRTTTTVAAATTTINDAAVPLAAGLDGVTIDETAVPLAAGLDGVTIDDEAVALADSIPQTGDNAVPVAPVAATGIAALMAAFFMGRRKKEDQ